MPVVNQTAVGPSDPPMIATSWSMEPEGNAVQTIRQMMVIAVAALMIAKVFLIFFAYLTTTMRGAGPRSGTASLSMDMFDYFYPHFIVIGVPHSIRPC